MDICQTQRQEFGKEYGGKMIAKKCDRCGAYYDKNEKHKVVIGVCNEKIECVAILTSSEKIYRRADLCDDCIDELKDFLCIKNV